MPTWLAQFSDPGTTARLGPLEWRILEAMWAEPAPRSVRDLYPGFPDLAYTTLTSTLDRLCQKGLLERSRQGRSFTYQPRLSRPQFEVALATEALRSALNAEGTSDGLLPLLSYFVAAVSERDPKLLEKLEAEVHARRAQPVDVPG